MKITASIILRYVWRTTLNRLRIGFLTTVSMVIRLYMKQKEVRRIRKNTRKH